MGKKKPLGKSVSSSWTRREEGSSDGAVLRVFSFFGFLKGLWGFVPSMVRFFWSVFVFFLLRAAMLVGNEEGSERDKRGKGGN